MHCRLNHSMAIREKKLDQSINGDDSSVSVVLISFGSETLPIWSVSFQVFLLAQEVYQVRKGTDDKQR